MAAIELTTRTSTRTRPVSPRAGSSRLSRHQVSELQRARILAAAVDVVQKVGYARLSVAAIIGQARISRKTFYEVFANRENCVVAVFEQTHAEVRTRLIEAYAHESRWRDGIRCALGRLLVLIEEEPGLARFWIVEALGAEEPILQRRAWALEEIAAVIDRGRLATSGTRQPPELTAEGIVGGIMGVLYKRLISSVDESVTDLLEPLMYMIVLPYLGPRAANIELGKPTPAKVRAKPARSPASSTDPLEGLAIRLTYRTVRALTAIAEQPGASNREIAHGAGITDQGQISKLLMRLAGLELIENHGWGQPNGGANAWSLTQRGVQVVRATRPRDMLA
jgi:AcrR family transcriptional regulator